MIAFFIIAICALSMWLQWRNHEMGKRIEQGNLDLGFSIGRVLGRVESDEQWAHRLRLVTDDADTARTLADLEVQSAEWVTESRNRALEAGVSPDRVEQ